MCVTTVVFSSHEIGVALGTQGSAASENVNSGAMGVGYFNFATKAWVDSGEPAALDTTDPAPPTPLCDHVNQTGCNVDKRCAWVFDGGWSAQCVDIPATPVARRWPSNC